MANMIRADLGTDEFALTLEVDGLIYEVSQFNSVFALNEVPTAQVMLGIGRNLRDLSQAAAVNWAERWKTMRPADVYMKPKGDFSKDVPWPKRVHLFDGFIVGFARKMANGQAVAVVTLVHWSAALGFSLTMNEACHPTTSNSFAGSATVRHLTTNASGTTGAGDFASGLTTVGSLAPVRAELEADVWGAVKNMFCNIAAVPTQFAANLGAIVGGGDPKANDIALSALARIEGPGTGAALAYKYGVALPFDSEILGSAIGAVLEATRRELGREAASAFASTTFWDKLIQWVLPKFGLAFVPMVTRGLVVADCPAFSRGIWRTVSKAEYAVSDGSETFERPLRAVAVASGSAFITNANVATGGRGGQPLLYGGGYAVDRNGDDRGTVMLVGPPPWLQGLSGSRGTMSAAFGVDLTKAYGAYAKDVYSRNILRGRIGSFVTKLRFDIAPGSSILLKGAGDKFIENDELGIDMVGCSSRIITTISAEAGVASTTVQLTDMRTADENEDDRTTVDRHPLFGEAIHGNGLLGAPLVEGWESL